MQHAKDIGWLDIEAGEGGRFMLVDRGRMGHIVAELTDPESQHPALCVFLGAGRKDAALQQLYTQNNIKRHNSNARIRLRYDIALWESTRPVLFADGDLGCSPRSTYTNTDREGGHKHLVSWDCVSMEIALLVIWSRLVFLFADIVCIFADDFPDLVHVARLLVDCVEMRSASSLPTAIRPRVIVVVAATETITAQTEQFYRQLYSVSYRSVFESFSAVNIVQLENNRLSATIRFERLRALIVRQLDDMRTVRQDCGVLPNAIHLEELFHCAARHTASNIQQPFDFVKATRARYMVPSQLGAHLAHYQEIGGRAGVCYEQLAPSIASAILMDHYVPGMLGTIRVLACWAPY
jgi:hypothetical protein